MTTEDRCEALMEWAKTVKLEIYRKRLPTLDELASELLQERGRTDEETLIAHIRHRYTNYELLLHGPHWWWGTLPDDPHQIIQSRMNSYIGRVLAKKVKEERA